MAAASEKNVRPRLLGYLTAACRFEDYVQQEEKGQNGKQEQSDEKRDYPSDCTHPAFAAELAWLGDCIGHTRLYSRPRKERVVSSNIGFGTGMQYIYFLRP